MGLGSFAGSIVNAATNIWATNKNNKSAKHAAETQRGWEKYMSDTAHQREMEDLKKAGLNPILTATGGSGASTPSGATAQTHAYNPIDVFSAALQMDKTKKETEGIQAGIDKTNAETAQTNLDAAIKEKMSKHTIQMAKENVKESVARQAKLNEETKGIKQGAGSRILGTEPGKIIEDTVNKIKKGIDKKSAKDVINSNAWMGYPGLF